MARFVALAAVLLALLSSAASGATTARHRQHSPFKGLGAWIDIYSPQWNSPDAAIKSMAGHHVKTLYLQTGNYSHKMNVYRPAVAGRFIDAAHAHGIKVVAWFLPGLLVIDNDTRKAFGAINFRSATGQRFDGFALDVEATLVKSLKLRNHRLIRLSALIRFSVDKRYPLAAITPSPVGMSQYYWPNIPYRRLTKYYKVFMPMAYSSLRGITSRGGTLEYLSRTISDIRAASGKPDFPIHLIGGLTGSIGKKAMVGFQQAVTKNHVSGFSLYAFDRTTPAVWRALERAS